MENFLVALNVVLPIFITMMVGVAVKKFKMVDEKSLAVMNKLVFKIFMSVLLFLNIYNIGTLDVYSLDNISFFIFPFICVFIIYFLAYFYYRKTEKDRKKLAVLIQGSYRGNFVLFGIAIAENLFGDVGIATVSMLPAIIIPTFNILAVLTLEYYCAEEINWKKMFKSTLKNPLILATFLALISLKLNIKFSKPIYKTLVDLAKVTTPLAFVVLGASLEMKSMIKNIKSIISVNVMKLIVNPAIVIVSGHYLGFTPVQLVSFLSAAACPTAIASFTMAKEMGADGDLAGEIVASTSVISILTIFLWIVFLKNLSWI